MAIIITQSVWSVSYTHLDVYKRQGQKIVVDTGYVAVMDATCTMTTQSVPGLKNKMFGGEGFFNTVVTGPGHVVLQTMPISAIAGSLAQFFPSGK